MPNIDLHRKMGKAERNIHGLSPANAAKVVAYTLLSAFNWHETIEGHDYWQDVYKKLLDLTLDKEPL